MRRRILEPAAALLLALASCLIYLVFARNNLLPGIYADDLIYLLMAEDIGGLLYGRASEASAVWSWTPFPPLYPTLLATLGAGSGDVATGNLAAGLCALIGAGLTYAGLRSRQAALLGSALCACAWLFLPAVLFVCTSTMSEALYTTLSLAALLGAKHASRTHSVRAWAVVGVFVAAAMLTREIAITLAGALLVWAVWARSAPAASAASLSVVPLLIWRWSRTQSEMVRPGYIEDIATRIDGAGVGALSEYLLRDQAFGLWQGWNGLLNPLGLGGLYLISAATLLLALFAIVAGLKRNGLAAWYALAYLALVWVWPHREHDTRFLVPLLPVLCWLIYDAFADSGRSFTTGARRASMIAGLVVALAVYAPAWATIAQRYHEPLSAELQAARASKLWLAGDTPATATHNVRAYRALTDMLRGLREPLQNAPCVYSTVPERTLYFARVVALNPPLPHAPDHDFHQALDKCELVLTTWVHFHPVYPTGYPSKRLKDHQLIMEARAPWGERSILVGQLYAAPTPGSAERLEQND